jgi:hypothetical protein
MPLAVQVAERARAEEVARAERRAKARAEMAEANRLQLQLKVLMRGQYIGIQNPVRCALALLNFTCQGDRQSGTRRRTVILPTAEMLPILQPPGGCTLLEQLPAQSSKVG